MKSYASGPQDGTQLQRLVAPASREFPPNPKENELYYLFADKHESKENVNQPWFPRGLYVFNGWKWLPVQETILPRKTAVIGSQIIEVEQAGSYQELPKPTDGYQLASLQMKLWHRTAPVSGNASFWIDATKDGNVWATIWNGDRLAGLTVQYVECRKPRTFNISFFHSPKTTATLDYILKIDCDFAGELYINRGIQVKFDGASQTAFEVAENSL